MAGWSNEAAGGGVAMKAGAVVQGAGGRFVGTGKLTAQQEAFVAAYGANGCDAIKACVVAGYSNPHAAWAALRRNPAVLAAAQEAAGIGPDWDTLASMAAVRKIRDDETAPPGVKLAAAGRVLDEAARAKGAAVDAGQSGQPAAGETLAALARELADLLASRGIKPGFLHSGQVVDVQPIENATQSGGGPCVDDT